MQITSSLLLQSLLLRSEKKIKKSSTRLFPNLQEHHMRNLMGKQKKKQKENLIKKTPDLQNLKSIHTQKKKSLQNLEMLKA